MAEKRIGRWCLTALAAAACLSVWPWSMVHAAESGVEVTEITGKEQIAQVVNEGWDDGYYAEALVDTRKEEVKVDGEETTFEEAFDMEDTSEVPEMDSTQAVEEYFEDQVCETEVVEEGVVQVTNPYQTRQILVQTDQLDQDYGASDIFHLDAVGEYILQFDTEEATKTAYEQMHPVYGSACILNRVIQADDMLMSGAGSSQGSYSWGAAYMGMAQLKASPFLDTFRGNKVTVAVMDTGIDKSNLLFRGRTISGESRNFLPGDPAYLYDDAVVGHGTHVAGIVADSTPDNVELMVLKVFNERGQSSFVALRMAIYWAVDAGADVINMSLGADRDQRLVLEEASMDPYIDLAASNGVAVCVAAGNEQQDAGRIYPASNATAITVSAIREDGSFAADYSNYGSAVDFCAPGTGILSAARGGTLISLSGTSMASPHIAAAVAYVKMVMPDATVDQVRQVLRRYAADLGAPGKDIYYGYGAIQMQDLFEDYQNAVGKPVLSSLANVSGGIQIKWNAVSGATGYQVFRRTGTAGSWKKVKTIGSDKTLKWTDKTASDGKVYSYRICAVRNGSVGDPSTAKKLCRLKSLTLSSLRNVSGRKVTVKWKKNSKAGGFQIQYGRNKKFKAAATAKASAGSVTKTIAKLAKGKTYYVRIRSYKKTGGKTYYSAWSGARKVVVRK